MTDCVWWRKDVLGWSGVDCFEGPVDCNRVSTTASTSVVYRTKHRSRCLETDICTEQRGGPGGPVGHCPITVLEDRKTVEDSGWRCRIRFRDVRHYGVGTGAVCRD